MEVEQRGVWRRSEGRARAVFGSLKDLSRDFFGGRMNGGVLTLDLHLEDMVGVLEGASFGVSEEGYQAALEGSEASFYFAFGLWGRGNQMGDAEGAQSSLELAAWVPAVA